MLIRAGAVVKVGLLMSPVAMVYRLVIGYEGYRS